MPTRVFDDATQSCCNLLQLHSFQLPTSSRAEHANCVPLLQQHTLIIEGSFSAASKNWRTAFARSLTGYSHLQVDAFVCRTTLQPVQRLPTAHMQQGGSASAALHMGAAAAPKAAAPACCRSTNLAQPTGQPARLQRKAAPLVTGGLQRVCPEGFNLCHDAWMVRLGAVQDAAVGVQLGGAAGGS